MLPCFSTPRIIMQRCCASRMTATPCGAMASTMLSATQQFPITLFGGCGVQFGREVLDGETGLESAIVHVSLSDASLGNRMQSLLMLAVRRFHFGREIETVIAGFFDADVVEAQRAGSIEQRHGIAEDALNLDGEILG